jgi:hypothetical protein
MVVSLLKFQRHVYSSCRPHPVQASSCKGAAVPQAGQGGSSHSSEAAVRLGRVPS